MTAARLFLIFNFFFLGFVGVAHAYFDFSSEKSAPSSMNGLEFKTYEKFAQTWHLVTVRFREDSKELRFTYANELAWQHLSNTAGSKPYPEGAAFGKVAYATEKDTNFESSRVPSSKRRFQIMLKDNKRFTGTGGWGYALFDESGRVFPEEVKAQTAACYACHQIVTKLDYVFSKPLLSASIGSTSEFDISKAAPKWAVVKSNRVGGAADFLKGLSNNEVSSLGGSLRTAFFSGTFDEVMPLLIERAKSQKQAALFFVDDRNFSLARPLGASCLKLVVKIKSRVMRNETLCEPSDLTMAPPPLPPPAKQLSK